MTSFRERLGHDNGVTHAFTRCCKLTLLLCRHCQMMLPLCGCAREYMLSGLWQAMWGLYPTTPPRAAAPLWGGVLTIETHTGILPFAVHGKGSLCAARDATTTESTLVERLASHIFTCCTHFHLAKCCTSKQQCYSLRFMNS